MLRVRLQACQRWQVLRNVANVLLKLPLLATLQQKKQCICREAIANCGTIGPQVLCKKGQHQQQQVILDHIGHPLTETV